MPDFDVMVIGAGPSAVAALNRLPVSARICVATGEVSTAPPPGSKIHPKIQAVSLARGEPAGIANPSPLEGTGGSSLFETATIGGLANYWGQQFVRYRNNEPWPADVFSDHADYESECGIVESLFSLQGGVPSAAKDMALERSSPRLLTGTAADPGAGLFAMRKAFEGLAAQSHVTTRQGRALRWAKAANGWLIDFDSGPSLTAGMVLLASGVVGTARLMLASHPTLAAARFCDHTPWMLYTANAGRLAVPVAGADMRHFNVGTFRQDDAGGSRSFASLYDMRHGDLNLIVASLTGRSFACLDGIPAPWGSSLIKPMQVWTRRTVGTVDIGGAGSFAERREGVDTRHDEDLVALNAALRASGVRVLHVTKTAPGLGFHYHSLRVMAAGGRPLRVDDVLAEQTGGSIRCIDASRLDEIGVAPPTLTSMAIASRLAGRCL